MRRTSARGAHTAVAGGSCRWLAAAAAAASSPHLPVIAAIPARASEHGAVAVAAHGAVGDGRPVSSSLLRAPGTACWPPVPLSRYAGAIAITQQRSGRAGASCARLVTAGPRPAVERALYNGLFEGRD